VISARWLFQVVVSCVLIFILAVPMMIAWHEVAGHGLIGLLAGGKVARLQVLGLQLWPELAWTGIGQGFTNLGECDLRDMPTPTGQRLSDLAGSLSTWCVGFAACVVLWRSHWCGWRRAVLVCLTFWCTDLLSFTLPSLGLRRGIVFGSSFSEPYEAATALGIPGWLFQALAIGTSLMIISATVARLYAQRRSQRSG
jgi:hypothetical protein